MQPIAPLASEPGFAGEPLGEGELALSELDVEFWGEILIDELAAKPVAEPAVA